MQASARPANKGVEAASAQGDAIVTTGEIARISSKGGKDFLTVVTESANQHGKLVVRGTWTAVIRHGP